MCVTLRLIHHHRYVLSAPSKQLETLPGTLMLTDCLEACQANESCSAVNYETGLCVMFRSTADQLPGESATDKKKSRTKNLKWQHLSKHLKYSVQLSVRT